MEPFRALCLGDSKLNKNNILEKIFPHNGPSQKGVYSKILISKDSEKQKEIEFILLDNSGIKLTNNIIFESAVKSLVNTAKAIIFVYDATDEESFKSISNVWYNFAKSKQDPNNKPILIVAEIKTEIGQGLKVKEGEGAEYAQSIGAIFKEIKNLEIGLDELFNEIVSIYLEKEKNKEIIYLGDNKKKNYRR